MNLSPSELQSYENTPEVSGLEPCVYEITGSKHRLVKGSKCPTRQNDTEMKAVLAPQTLARLEGREWSGEFRITNYVETPYTLPPEQSGRRETKGLTVRAASKISASCQYVATAKGGYCTFLTLTFDACARLRMQDQMPEGPYSKVSWSNKGKPKHTKNITWLPAAEANPLYGNSIQNELSRFLDSLTKMYKRGWLAPYICAKPIIIDGAKFYPIEWKKFIKPLEQELCYLWVAEKPMNSQGSPNPHVHILLNWQVPKTQFRAWAKRIESIWGQGFGHLERIRNKNAADYYMKKAANYLSKSVDTNDQGCIRGNRYGINKAARAPGWIVHNTWAQHIMLQLIERTRTHVERKTEPIKQEMKYYQQLRNQSPKRSKKWNTFNEHIQKRRKILNDIPVYFGEKSIFFKCMEAADKFLTWCYQQGWQRLAKPAGAYLNHWNNKIEKIKQYRENKYSHLKSNEDLQNFIETYDNKEFIS